MQRDLCACWRTIFKRHPEALLLGKKGEAK